MTERICHQLIADDAVIRVPPERYLRCVEADAAFYASERDRLAKELARVPKAERKPRRKSVKALLDTAKKAGLPVKAIRPDGSVEIGAKPDNESTLVNGNPWDDVLHGSD